MHVLTTCVCWHVLCMSLILRIYSVDKTLDILVLCVCVCVCVCGFNFSICFSFLCSIDFLFSNKLEVLYARTHSTLYSLHLFTFSLIH